MGVSHPHYAGILNNLGSLYQSEGDYARAEEHYRRALEVKNKSVGEMHPDCLTSLNNLAMLYHRQGDAVQAENLYLKALQISKQHLEKEDPRCAAVLNNLSALYESQGDYARAELLVRQALEIKKEILGENHSDYAMSLNNLAMLLHSQGDYVGAEPLYSHAMEIRKSTLGEMHPDYAQSLNNLAFLHHSLGDYTKAEPLYNHALKISLANLKLAAPLHTERRQLAITAVARYQLHNYLGMATVAPDFYESAYRQLLAWKGVVLENQQTARAVRDQPDFREKFVELERVTSQLSQLALATPSSKQQVNWRKRIAVLQEKLEVLQQEFAATSATYREARRGVQLEDLRAALPEDSVLVDFFESGADKARKPGTDVKNAIEPHVLVFIVGKTGPIQLTVLDNPSLVENQIDSCVPDLDVRRLLKGLLRGFGNMSGSRWRKN